MAAFLSPSVFATRHLKLHVCYFSPLLIQKENSFLLF